MPKTVKKSFLSKRSSPFEMYLEKLIVYELTKPDKSSEEQPTTSTAVVASSVTSSSESDMDGSISSSSSSCDTESETGRSTPQTSKNERPSVIVENVNYVVDII